MLFDFSEFTFSKNSFRNIIKVASSLDPDQDCQNVGPDLGPSSFQRIQTDDKSHSHKGKSLNWLKFGEKIS